MSHYQEYKANLVQKTGFIIRSTRRTWYKKRASLSGVQDEPCTKNGLNSQEYKANLVRKTAYYVNLYIQINSFTDSSYLSVRIISEDPYPFISSIRCTRYPLRLPHSVRNLQGFQNLEGFALNYVQTDI